MPGLSFKHDSTDGYRFGFNTQEKEPELAAGITSAEFWMYDGRLARRWNIDPITHPNLSPYSVFHNNPLFFNDRLGDDTSKTTTSVYTDFKLDDKDKSDERGTDKIIEIKRTTKISDPNEKGEYTITETQIQSEISIDADGNVSNITITEGTKTWVAKNMVPYKKITFAMHVNFQPVDEKNSKIRDGKYATKTYRGWFAQRSNAFMVEFNKVRDYKWKNKVSIRNSTTKEGIGWEEGIVLEGVSMFIGAISGPAGTALGLTTAIASSSEKKEGLRPGSSKDIITYSN